MSNIIAVALATIFYRDYTGHGVQDSGAVFALIVAALFMDIGAAMSRMRKP